MGKKYKNIIWYKYINGEARTIASNVYSGLLYSLSVSVMDGYGGKGLLMCRM
jgi:hypothetical protein